MSSKKIIAFGADHAGYALKSALLKTAETLGYTVLDVGTNDSETSVNYASYAWKVVEEIVQGRANRGILICGSGIGVDIAANRHPKIRSALCASEELAQLARAHNDANVLCLGARFMSSDEAVSCAKTFLETKFEEGRHTERVESLATLTWEK